MTLRDLTIAKAGSLLLALMGALALAGCGGGSAGTTTTTPTTPATNNTAALTVGFGSGGAAGQYYDGVFTTITVCAPGSTSNCQTLDNVLVDTGSTGLRVLNSAVSNIVGSLGKIQDSSQDQLQACIQYADTSYNWGPMMLADVSIAGEKASSLPIQVIGGNTFTVPALCLATPVNPGLPNGGNEDTLATLGANGILGIGNSVWDCGTSCASVATGSTYSGYPYFICPTGQACEETGVPTADQATNPIAAFSSSDNNGVMITLGSVPPAGAATVSGTMNFGIGTQSDNALGSATLYALDANLNLPTLTYGGTSYNSAAFFDTGSNALYVLDHTTLGINDCADNGYYCPASTLTLSNFGLTGYGNVGSGTISLSIANADALFAANPTFAAFNNLGADSGTGPSNDSFDFGAPFFLGRTVFVGIAGATVPNGASAPNGFVAF